MLLLFVKICADMMRLVGETVQDNLGLYQWKTVDKFTQTACGCLTCELVRSFFARLCSMRGARAGAGAIASASSRHKGDCQNYGPFLGPLN